MAKRKVAKKTPLKKSTGKAQSPAKKVAPPAKKTPAKVVAKAKPKPLAKVSAKVPAKPTKKPTPPRINIVVDKADEGRGESIDYAQPLSQQKKLKGVEKLTLPTIIPHDDDKKAGMGLGYSAPKPTGKKGKPLVIDIVPDAEDAARGISPEYEVGGQNQRLAVRRDGTTHSGSGSLIPDADNNLGQHDF